MATVSRSVTPASFKRLARPLLGLPITRVWQSFDFTLFLELGRLTWEPYPEKPARRLSKRGRWKGQAGAMLAAGWRIERVDGILADFRSKPGEMNRAVRSLRGRKVEAVDVEGRLPELSLRISGGLWVRSLTVSSEGTEWALFLSDRPETSVWLTSRGRSVIREVAF